MPRFILTLAILLGTSLASAAQTASAMLDAARAFLATLDAAQKSKAVLPFNSEERFRWFYTPVSRKGLPLKEMNPAQQRAALALLHAGLQRKGLLERPRRSESSKMCCANWNKAKGRPAIPTVFFYFLRRAGRERCVGLAI